MKPFQARLLVASLAILVALGLVGQDAVWAQTTVNMWFPSSFYTDDAVRAFFDEFREEFNRTNPDIQLEYRFVAGGLAGLNEAVAIGVATDTGPDIAYTSSNTLGRLTHGSIHGGLARPLDEYLATWEFRDDVLPDLLKELRVDGKTYALPFIMWPVMHVYNYDLYAQSGVAIPSTWDEQLDAVRALTRVGPDGNVLQWGYKGPMTDFYAFYTLGRTMEQLGRRIIEPEETEGSLNNPEAREAMRYLQELYRLGMPDGRYGTPAADILGNRVATFHAQTTSATVVQLHDTGISYGFHRFVGPTEDTHIVQAISGTLYMLSTSPHPDEAWRVLEAFLHPDNLKKYYLVELRWQPVHRSLFADPDITARPQSLMALQLMVPPITSYGPAHPLLTEIHYRAGAYLMQGIIGNMPIESALEEAERVMNATLRDYMLIP